MSRKPRRVTTAGGNDPEPAALRGAWPLPSDRPREWSLVAVDRYTGLPRELRITARSEGEAVFLAYAEMDESEDLDSIREA